MEFPSYEAVGALRLTFVIGVWAGTRLFRDCDSFFNTFSKVCELSNICKRNILCCIALLLHCICSWWNHKVSHPTDLISLDFWVKISRKELELVLILRTINSLNSDFSRFNLIPNWSCCDVNCRISVSPKIFLFTLYFHS